MRVTISGAGRIGVSVSDKETWSLDVPRRRLTIEARGTEESGRCQITRGDGGGLEARCALRHRRSEIGVAHLRLLEDLTVDLSHVQHRRHPTTMTLKTGPAKLG